MTQDTYIDAILSFFPWGFVKLSILILIGMYLVFAAIIVRQETLMSRVVVIPLSPVLRIFAVGHLIAAAAVFFFALVLL